MWEEQAPAGELQSQFTDEFFYFFMKLRKDRVRKVVARMRKQFPDETREQLARRLIASKAGLSFVSGTITHLPMLVPGVGQALKLVGLVGGTSVMTRMHLYLILEIALIYGKDIDDRSRVAEMVAVAACVAAGAAAPLLVHLLEVNPLYALPAAAFSAAATTHLIGESAIKLYTTTDSAPYEGPDAIAPESVI
jgi:uncharacterized protein (DUF697 family)